MFILLDEPVLPASGSSGLDYSKYKEVLVIAPHNDDEILGSGGVIQKHLNNGANVRVVMMTNGDGQYRGPFLSNKKREIELVIVARKRQSPHLEASGLARKILYFSVIRITDCMTYGTNFGITASFTAQKGPARITPNTATVSQSAHHTVECRWLMI
jgi:hypothetical protein